jgi:hypothetical protein
MEIAFFYFTPAMILREIQDEVLNLAYGADAWAEAELIVANRYSVGLEAIERITGAESLDMPISEILV